LHEAAAAIASPFAGSDPMNAVANDASLQFVMSSLGQSFTPAFVASLLIIIVSELGDKTFFIAALMSMKHSPVVVFCGGIAALSIMTVLSVAVGYTLPNIVNPIYTHYATTILFLCFGARMLFDAFRMDSREANGELAEVEAELNKKSDLEVSCSTTCSSDPEDVVGVSPVFRSMEMAECGEQSQPPVSKTKGLPVPDVRRDVSAVIRRSMNAVMFQAFTMTFLAEWGDRSQIATIALAAAKNPMGVTLGALLGHGICTSLAVVGGKFLASNISERTVTYTGGVLFVFFGMVGVFQHG